MAFRSSFFIAALNTFFDNLTAAIFTHTLIFSVYNLPHLMIAMITFLHFCALIITVVITTSIFPA